MAIELDGCHGVNSEFELQGFGDGLRQERRVMDPHRHVWFPRTQPSFILEVACLQLQDFHRAKGLRFLITTPPNCSSKVFGTST